jgi:hypothetical protein
MKRLTDSNGTLIACLVCEMRTDLGSCDCCEHLGAAVSRLAVYENSEEADVDWRTNLVKNYEQR